MDLFWLGHKDVDQDVFLFSINDSENIEQSLVQYLWKSIMDKYKKFKCNICDHSDDSKAHLDVHIDAVHLGVRYNCDLCDKSYRYEHHVRKHKAAVHEKLRPFVCNLCGKTYSDNTPLRVHMEVAHSKKGNFPCPECGRVFSHNVKMKTHYSHTHGGGQPNQGG